MDALLHLGYNLDDDEVAAGRGYQEPWVSPRKASDVGGMPKPADSHYNYALQRSHQCGFGGAPGYAGAPTYGAGGGGYGAGGGVLARASAASSGLIAAREELAALEEKVNNQVLRLQEQIERFMDMMLQPVEAKLRSLEERQPLVEARIGELIGGIQGLQMVADTHTQRADAMETRFRRWRKLLEEDFNVKQAELKFELSQSVTDLSQTVNKGVVSHAVTLQADPKVQGYVTRDEMVDIVDLIKQELRHLVESTMPRERELILATQQEMGHLAQDLQRRLGEVQQQVLSGASPAQQEITQAAEALRCELKLLSERKLCADEGAIIGLRELEKATEQSRREMSELKDRTRRHTALMEDVQRDVKHVREELTSMKSREIGLEAVTRSEAERIAEQAFDRLWHNQSALGRSLGGRSMLRGSPASIQHSEAMDADEKGPEDRARDSRLEAVAVLVQAASSRLETVEERQALARQEAIEQDVDGRLERTWKVVEEEASLRGRLQCSLEDLSRRVAALERRPPEPSLPMPSSRGDAAGAVSLPIKKSHGMSMSEAAQMADNLAASLRSARCIADNPFPEEGPGDLFSLDEERCSPIAWSAHKERAKEHISEYKAEIAEVWRAIAELAELAGAKTLESCALDAGEGLLGSQSSDGSEPEEAACSRGVAGRTSGGGRPGAMEAASRARRSPRE